MYGDLKIAFIHGVYQQNAEGNAHLNFAEWGRMIDMGVDRGHPLGRLKATTEAIAAKSRTLKAVLLGA